MLTFRARRIRELGLCGFGVVFLANCSGQKFAVFHDETKSSSDSGAGRPGRGSGGDTADASGDGGARGSGATSATGGQVDGGGSSGSSSVGGGTVSSGGAAGSSQAGASGKGSGGRGSGGSLQSGGAVGTGGSRQSGGASGSGGRGSGGVIQTGGAPPTAGAGGGMPCGGNECAACCDRLYPTTGGPTMTGSRIFSGQFYGCACSTVCYTECADSLCNSQDPHPAPPCLKCLQRELGGGLCQTSWTACQQTKVCSNFGTCAFGCL